MIENKPGNTVPNIWTAQESLIHFYRLLAVGFGVLALSMLVVTIVLGSRNPLVIVRSGATQEFYPSSRSQAPIEKSDVEAFAKRFLSALYVWNDYSTEKIAKEISPFSEEGLVQKITEAQSLKYLKELKGKRLAQAITFVEVDVQDAQVICRFDRVLKIEGISLVIPTEVTLSMIEGDATSLNPMGIFISGILERDGGK